MHLCCGKFGLQNRLGLADGIHIFNSAGVKCYEAKRDASADVGSPDEDPDDGQESGAATVPEKAPLPATGEAMTLSLYVSCELITSNKRGYCRGFGIGA